MKFACKAVDLAYLDIAPLQFRNEIVIDAAAESVFAVLEDGNSWPKWFKDIANIEWTTPKPFGVGTKRTIKMHTQLVADEEFFVWKQGKEFAFYFTYTNLPVVNALCEHYYLEPLGENQCKFTYRIGAELMFPTTLLAPIANILLGNMFEKGTKSLAKYMKEK